MTSSSSEFDIEEIIELAKSGGNKWLIEKLVEKGFDINTTDKKKVSILHIAAGKNYLDLLRYAVDKGADVNAQDIYGNTALHLLSTVSNVEAVQFLVEKGANPHLTTHTGKTPLHYSIYAHPFSVNYLTSKSTPSSSSSSSSSYSHSSSSSSKLQHNEDGKWNMEWVEKKKEIISYYIHHFKISIDQQDSGGDTILHLATRSGCLPLVTWLVEVWNANTMQPNFLNESVFHTACEAGHFPIVRYLFTHIIHHHHGGGDEGDDHQTLMVKLISTKNVINQTSLMAAIIAGNIEIVQYLIDSLNISSPSLSTNHNTHDHINDHNNNTTTTITTYRSSSNNNNKVIEILPDALHIATKYSHLHLVRYLIYQVGYDVNNTNHHNQSALMIATKENIDVAIIDLILQNVNIDVNIVDAYQHTALMYAIQNHSSFEVVRWLVEGRDYDNEWRYASFDIPFGVDYSHLSSDRYVNLYLRYYRDLFPLLSPLPSCHPSPWKSLFVQIINSVHTLCP